MQSYLPLETPLEQMATSPLQLSSTQRKVIEYLQRIENEKYPLSKWYHGSIITFANPHNPDRYAQAAHSLRELIEKIPYVINSFLPEKKPEKKVDLIDKRRKIEKDLHKKKQSYSGVWVGKSIDSDVEKILLSIEEYIKLNKTKTRSEKVSYVLHEADPLFHVYEETIQNERKKFIQDCWVKLQKITHHKSNIKESDFSLLLENVEKIILSLSSKEISEEQKFIHDIISQQSPSEEDIQSVLKIIKRFGANYEYFFRNVKNVVWFTPLKNANLFKLTQQKAADKDNRSFYPINYLIKIANINPEKVIEVILNFGDIKNASILYNIAQIASDLKDPEQSFSLCKYVMQYARQNEIFIDYRLIIKIINKWAEGTNASSKQAHKLIQFFIAFQPSTNLPPRPRLEEWDYEQFLDSCVKPRSRKEPFLMSGFLLKAVEQLIPMTLPSSRLDGNGDEDYSDIWCERLNISNRYTAIEAKLVLALVFACEQVFEHAPNDIEKLNECLCAQRWKLFKRIRYHLYAKHPTEQTLPWIRECIVGHAHYSDRIHHYDFQRMFRSACETFGTDLLNDTQQAKIFAEIIKGPSRERYKAWLGKEYTEARFKNYKNNLLLHQLHPFASLLKGKNLKKYNQLLQNHKPVLTDESYPPHLSEGCRTMSFQSPISTEDLLKKTDKKILNYINDWNDPHEHPDDWSIEITFAALAGEFQNLFSTAVMANEKRLDFWLTHKSSIKRPIYIKAMLQAMLKSIEQNSLANLDKWLDFCLWVLQQPNSPPVEGDPAPSEESTDNPCWREARRAVLELVVHCVNNESNIPFSPSIRSSLSNILDALCTQFDWRLDCNQPVLVDEARQVDEAINNIRSYSLQILIDFGLWVRRQLPEDPVDEVTNILSKRIADNAQYPLTRPEYAILGMWFSNLYNLNPAWSTEQKEKLFPQLSLDIWKESFGAFLCYNHPWRKFLELFYNDYKLAIQNIGSFSNSESLNDSIVKSLGNHLFIYYLWEKYSLDDEANLLAQFYDKTSSVCKHQTALFKYIGNNLKNSPKNLEKILTKRAMDFFEWRLGNANPEELQDFSDWLSAECLPADWRLNSFLKVLDRVVCKDTRLSTEIDALYSLLPSYEHLALQCFLKITEKIDPRGYAYFGDNAEKLLSAGLASTNEQVKHHAEQAQENLLKRAYDPFMLPEVK